MRTKQLSMTLRKTLPLLATCLLRFRTCLLLPAASLFLLTACQTDDLPGTAGDDGGGNGQPIPEELIGQPINFGGLTVTEITTDANTRAVTRTTTTPYVNPGATITIKMTVTTGTTTYADYTCTDAGLWQPIGNPLYWVDPTSQHTFTAYSPALTDEEKSNGRSTAISLPANWNKELYETYGTYMAGTPVTTSIASTVALSLTPLLTRIEVRMKDNALTYAPHLAMLTKTQGQINGVTASVLASASVQKMDLWKTTDGASASTLFCGYALPQTYAKDAQILMHYDLSTGYVKIYKADNSLTTQPGSIVTFTVDAQPGEFLNVPAAGGLEEVLNDYAGEHGGSYPSRLKITGSLNKTDLTYLIATSGIVSVNMEDVTVPDEDFEELFRNYAGTIRALILPDKMKGIPASAFRDNKLKSIMLPDGLTEIGESAFRGSKLKSIMLPDGLTKIGKFAFSGSKLKSIVLPDGLTEIGNGAFSDSSLCTLDVPASIETIGTDICKSSYSLNTVTIHCPLDLFVGSSFKQCTSLSTIICVDNALFSKNVDWYVFAGTPITNLDFLPSSIISMGGRSFQDCLNLVNVEFPVNVNHIWLLFEGCKNLNKIAVDGTISIDGNIGTINSSSELFLYNTGLTENDERVNAFKNGTWGEFAWSNVHWGYKGIGSKFDRNNYNYHRN